MENSAAPTTGSRLVRAIGAVVLSSILGLAVVLLFRRVFPAGNSFFLIPATLMLDLAGIAVLLMLLPQWGTVGTGGRWRLLMAWLKTSLLGVIAFVAMALAATNAEPART